MNIGFEDIITEKCLSLSVMLVEADVVNTPTSEELEAVLDDVCMEIAGRYQLGEINKRPGIAVPTCCQGAGSVPGQCPCRCNQCDVIAVRICHRRV